MSTSTQSVTVVDRTPPVFTFVPPDLVLNSCGPVDSVELGLPAALDDCDGPLTLTNDAPKKFDVGKTIVKWTATDASGHQSVDSQTVIVVPPASCGQTGGSKDGDDR